MCVCFRECERLFMSVRVFVCVSVCKCVFVRVFVRVCM